MIDPQFRVRLGQTTSRDDFVRSILWMIHNIDLTTSFLTCGFHV